MYIWLVIGGVFVLVTVWMNLRGRKRERALSQLRGKQAQADFVAMFSNETEQVIAWKIYEVLQSYTFTHEFAFREEDLLFGDPLFLDEEDLYYEIEGLRQEWDLSFALDPELADALFSSRTVGDLVRELANLYRVQKLPKVYSPSMPEE